MKWLIGGVVALLVTVTVAFAALVWWTKRHVKRKGRNLRPGEARAWTRPYFEAFGLLRLGGTIRYPEAA